MTSGGINLDPESLSIIVQKAILDSLTPEARDQIMVDAIANLLTIPKKEQYGRQMDTPLQEAFKSAVHSAAVTVVRDMVQSDEAVQAKILELVSTPIAEITKGNWDGLPDRIGEAIGSTVAEWLRDRSRS